MQSLLFALLALTTFQAVVAGPFTGLANVASSAAHNAAELSAHFKAQANATAANPVAHFVASVAQNASAKYSGILSVDAGVLQSANLNDTHKETSNQLAAAQQTNKLIKADPTLISRAEATSIVRGALERRLNFALDLSIQLIAEAINASGVPNAGIQAFDFKTFPGLKSANRNLTASLLPKFDAIGIRQLRRSLAAVDDIPRAPLQADVNAAAADELSTERAVRDAASTKGNLTAMSSVYVKAFNNARDRKRGSSLTDFGGEFITWSNEFGFVKGLGDTGVGILKNDQTAVRNGILDVLTNAVKISVGQLATKTGVVVELAEGATVVEAGIFAGIGFYIGALGNAIKRDAARADSFGCDSPEFTAALPTNDELASVRAAQKTPIEGNPFLLVQNTGLIGSSISQIFQPESCDFVCDSKGLFSVGHSPSKLCTYTNFYPGFGYVQIYGAQCSVPRVNPDFGLYSYLDCLGTRTGLGQDIGIRKSASDQPSLSAREVRYSCICSLKQPPKPVEPVVPRTQPQSVISSVKQQPSDARVVIPPIPQQTLVTTSGKGGVSKGAFEPEPSRNLVGDSGPGLGR